MRRPFDQTPLDENVGYVLKVAATALHTAMDAALRPAGLSVSQFSCLEQLARTPGLSNAQLARGAFVTPQSMNDLLQGLQRRGLVERPDEADVGRARPTRLTLEGRHAVEAARKALTAVNSRIDALDADHPTLLSDLKAAITAFGQESPSPRE